MYRRAHNIWRKKQKKKAEAIFDEALKEHKESRTKYEAVKSGEGGELSTDFKHKARSLRKARSDLKKAVGKKQKKKSETKYNKALKEFKESRTKYAAVEGGEGGKLLTDLKLKAKSLRKARSSWKKAAGQKTRTKEQLSEDWNSYSNSAKKRWLANEKKKITEDRRTKRDQAKKLKDVPPPGAHAVVIPALARLADQINRYRISVERSLGGKSGKDDTKSKALFKKAHKEHITSKEKDKEGVDNILKEISQNINPKAKPKAKPKA